MSGLSAGDGLSPTCFCWKPKDISKMPFPKLITSQAEAASEDFLHSIHLYVLKDPYVLKRQALILKKTAF